MSTAPVGSHPTCILGRKAEGSPSIKHRGDPLPWPVTYSLTSAVKPLFSCTPHPWTSFLLRLLEAHSGQEVGLSGPSAACPRAFSAPCALLECDLLHGTYFFTDRHSEALGHWCTKTLHQGFKGRWENRAEPVPEAEEQAEWTSVLTQTQHAHTGVCCLCVDVISFIFVLIT